VVAARAAGHVARDSADHPTSIPTTDDDLEAQIAELVEEMRLTRAVQQNADALIPDATKVTPQTPSRQRPSRGRFLVDAENTSCSAAAVAQSRTAGRRSAATNAAAASTGRFRTV